MNKHKRYIICMALAVAILLLPELVNLLFVVRSLENISYEEVVRIQLAENALYGTAFNQNAFEYKRLLCGARNPKVVVLGSSRMMQLRQEFFTVSFVNCSGSMHSLQEGHLFLKKMIEQHTPEVVLLGIDFWWFHPERVHLTDFSYHSLQGEQVTFKKFTQPLWLIFTGKVSISEYIDILIYGARTNAISSYSGIGLDAILHSNGFRPDGSYLYGSTIFEGESGDVEFEKTLSGLRNGDGRFVHAQQPDQAMFAILNDMLRMCESKGVEVVLVVPPVAPRIALAMEQNGGFDYVRALHNELHNLGVPVLDGFDAEAYGSEDCEFIDGYHPGDVAVQRMLLAGKGAIAVAKYIDAQCLSKSVERFSGNVLTVYDENAITKPEMDFLQMGCLKR